MSGMSVYVNVELWCNGEFEAMKGEGKPVTGISLLLLKCTKEATRFNIPHLMDESLSTIYMPSLHMNCRGI